jgi:hypothetical protein
MSVASQKRRPFSVDFIPGNRLKHMEAGQENMEDSPVSSHCSLLRNPQPKPAGVLEHCREGQTNCWFSILQGLSF